MVLFTDCSSVSKESACNAGDPGLIPGSGRSPGERNGHPSSYSCLENRMDRGARQAIVHGVTRVGHDLATKPPSTTVISIALLDGQGLFKTARTENSSSVTLFAFSQSGYFRFFLLNFSICLPEYAL